MTPSMLTTDRAILPVGQWQRASWQDYLALRDAESRDRIKLAFHQGKLWIEMGGEGINHANVSDLFTMLFAFWAVQYPEQTYNSFGRCLLEKPETQACDPDLVLYVGENFSRWEEGQPRVINLAQWHVPDLIGEIADTTLATDLDEQKHLYAALQIPEYWVVDVRGRRVFAFALQETGNYEACTESKALLGLPIALLDRTLERLSSSTNTAVASWFQQQITQLEIREEIKD